MKKLQMNDLTPALLKEIKNLATPEEIIAFLQSKDLEVSAKGAQRILDNLKQSSSELSDDELDKVTGGCGDSDNNAYSS